MTGKVAGIFIAERGSKPLAQSTVEAHANKGIVGDRYYNGEGTFSKKLEGNRKREITFIASEEIARFNISQGESLSQGDARRNIVTQDIDLQELIGKEFGIGSARFRGIGRCEPCAHRRRTQSSIRQVGSGL